MKTEFLTTKEVLDRLDNEACITKHNSIGWQEVDLNKFEWDYGSSRFIVTRFGADEFRLGFKPTAINVAEVLKKGTLDEIILEIGQFVKTIPFVIQPAGADFVGGEHLFSVVDHYGYDNVGEYLSLDDAKKHSGTNYTLPFKEIEDTNSAFFVLDAENGGCVSPEKETESILLNYGCGCDIRVHNDYTIFMPCHKHTDLNINP